MSFLWLLILNAAKDSLAVDVLAALADDGVADLTDQDDKASRGVVIGGIGPDHEDHVHDRNEEVGNLSEFLAQISKLVKQSSKGLEILEVLIGLRASSLNFLLKLAEGSGVGGFVLLEELENLLDAFGVKLVADSVQVLRFVLPELDLSQGIGVLVSLEGAFGILLKDILNLFGPCNDCA